MTIHNLTIMFLELGKVLRTIAYDGIAKIVISGSSIRVVREPKAKHSGRSSMDEGVVHRQSARMTTLHLGDSQEWTYMS